MREKYKLANSFFSLILNLVLSLDSIDRDPLSKERYVKNFAGRLSQIPTWNNGENHLVFNLYSGTWPDYLEDLGFDLGHAMLAKASISYQKYRRGFDVSLPLWGETHPSKGKHYAESAVAKWPSFGAHLMSFKGKQKANLNEDSDSEISPGVELGPFLSQKINNIFP